MNKATTKQHTNCFTPGAIHMEKKKETPSRGARRNFTPPRVDNAPRNGTSAKICACHLIHTDATPVSFSAMLEKLEIAFFRFDSDADMSGDEKGGQTSREIGVNFVVCLVAIILDVYEIVFLEI
jgi:hypothetical protein